MESQVFIGGRRFSLVRVQRGKTAIYRSRNRYMRLGRQKALARELARHEEMLARGFPVARILTRGIRGDFLYFIEESLGKKSFGQLFAEDVRRRGAISRAHFQAFLDITAVFAAAQLRAPIAPTGSARAAEFSASIHLGDLCRELPGDARRIRRRFSDAMARVRIFPHVLTHGDFNPHNIYPAGVIDLESVCDGLAGYDIVTNIVHNDYFPVSKKYEFYQKYAFTDTQKARYMTAMDMLYRAAGLPALSPYARDFAFCRAVWSAVRMREYPKIQAFRYNMLHEQFLTD